MRSDLTFLSYIVERCSFFVNTVYNTLRPEHIDRTYWLCLQHRRTVSWSTWNEAH